MSLIVDLDPQGNASTGLGIEQKRRRRSTYDVLIPRRSRCATPSRRRRSRDCTSCHRTMDLSGFELEIAHERDRAYRLRDSLRTLNAVSDGIHYGYVLGRTARPRSIS